MNFSYEKKKRVTDEDSAGKQESLQRPSCSLLNFGANCSLRINYIDVGKHRMV